MGTCLFHVTFLCCFSTDAKVPIFWRGERMDKEYQMQLSVQDLKQASKIMRRAADRIESINQTESFTLHTLISDIEELTDRLDNKG